MAATLNEGDVGLEVEEAWEQGCASLVPDKSRARIQGQVQQPASVNCINERQVTPTPVQRQTECTCSRCYATSAYQGDTKAFRESGTPATVAGNHSDLNPTPITNLLSKERTTYFVPASFIIYLFHGKYQLIHSKKQMRHEIGENPQTIRENAEILLEASKGIGLEVNPEKTKYMIMSRDQNIVRNGNIKIGDLSFEEVEKFKYLGATVTNINDTREEIKRRINMGNACYYSVEKLLSYSLLSKNLKVRIYKAVILPVVLYGSETWTLTLREEQRLRVFENKILRKIFGAKKDEVTGEWRKLHNAELHALYSSPDIIRNIKSRRLRWAGHVARMGESRNAYRVLVGRPEGKRPLGRPRRRWEDNIKMYLREVGYDDRDWINLVQDRDQWRAYVRAAMNLRDTGPRRRTGKQTSRRCSNQKEGGEEDGVKKETEKKRAEAIVFPSGTGNGREPKGQTRIRNPPPPPCLTTPPSPALLLQKIASSRYMISFQRNGPLLLSKNLKVRIYKTVILPVVLYGCETWTLTLREEQRLRVFENKVLRKIFGAKSDEVTGEWRKLHNSELHALYSSPDIIRNIKSRRLRLAGHVARMGESRNAYRVLVGRPEVIRPLGRPRRRWEDNIKMDLREVGYDDREWINIAQDRDQWRSYVKAAMNLRVP
ncbi:hypothetical protein ANN_25727 [Periplaneta americana]|uniref:Endonuclease-reverse transcriptase n=1 Tax=Periplaneta americana TaxID=6978 RepID=A0ABQ8S4C8_PERAM|nr:hypothetical protein ANN_25727 [Periplaneta americana]